MVGLGGLEPPTFRLSAGCSNQMSYRPLALTAGLEPATKEAPKEGLEPPAKTLTASCSTTELLRNGSGPCP